MQAQHTAKWNRKRPSFNLASRQIFASVIRWQVIGMATGVLPLTVSWWPGFLCSSVQERYQPSWIALVPAPMHSDTHCRLRPAPPAPRAPLPRRTCHPTCCGTSLPACCRPTTGRHPWCTWPELGSACASPAEHGRPSWKTCRLRSRAACRCRPCCRGCTSTPRRCGWCRPRPTCPRRTGRPLQWVWDRCGPLTLDWTGGGDERMPQVGARQGATHAPQHQAGKHASCGRPTTTGAAARSACRRWRGWSTTSTCGAPRRRAGAAAPLPSAPPCLRRAPPSSGTAASSSRCPCCSWRTWRGCRCGGWTGGSGHSVHAHRRCGASPSAQPATTRLPSLTPPRRCWTSPAAALPAGRLGRTPLTPGCWPACRACGS